MSRKLPPPKPKPKVRVPNLPQHDLPAPYMRLLTLGKGDFESVYDTMANTLKEGNAESGAARLLEMVLDETYSTYDEDDPRVWTDLHALRVLMRMGAAAQVGIEPLLPLLNAEDDYTRDELPFYYAEMGQPAVEPLARIVRDDTADTFLRSGAGESLAEIGEKFPELRSEIITILEETLLVEQDDDSVAALLIVNLLDLGAEASLPIIEKAFEEGRVDEAVVSLADVQEHFGLPITAERPKWNYPELGGEPYEEDADAVILPFSGSTDEASSRPYIAPEKVGRNDPCPCGSGKKYKKCCGAAA